MITPANPTRLVRTDSSNETIVVDARAIAQPLIDVAVDVHAAAESEAA